MPVLTLVQYNPLRESVSDDSFEQYLNERGYAANTVSAYLSDLRRYEVTEATTQDRHEQIAREILDESSAPSTVNRRLSALASFYAHTHPDAGRNPYRTVRRPTKGVVLPEVVSTPEEAREIIAQQQALRTPTGYRTAAAVALMAGAGLRVSEVCDLRFGDLNLRSSSLRVVNGKGSKTRDVPLSDFVLDAIRTYVTAVLTAQPAPDDRIIDVSVRTVQRDVAAASQAAGNGRNLHPHAFRHGFATAVYRATTDLRLTGDLLGHASVTTTMLYTHLADDRRIAAVNGAL